MTGTSVLIVCLSHAVGTKRSHREHLLPDADGSRRHSQSAESEAYEKLSAMLNPALAHAHTDGEPPCWAMARLKAHKEKPVGKPASPRIAAEKRHIGTVIVDERSP